MKNIISLFVISFFVQNVFCNADLLAKFHQHTYKVKDVRLQVISYDKQYANVFEIKAFKFNRTTTAFNATFNLKVNFGNKLELVVQAHKFLSNEYRRLALRYQVNLKKSFDTNMSGMQAVKKCGNITDGIFYKDITYHACNFVNDETKLPPLIPSGMYRADNQITYLDVEVAMIHIFFEIYTPIYYPKD